MNNDVDTNTHHQLDGDDDELIRLVTSNADASSQYVIFRNGEDELYAINVAKVEELIALKEIEISKNSNAFGLTAGVAKVRGNIISIVVFDRWLGKAELDMADYELAMMCNYGNHRMGLVIKNVLGIMNIDSKNFQDNSDKDEKTAYVTDITLGGVSGLCFVFDSDKMLLEVFPRIENDELDKAELIEIKKEIKGKVLHAEDSSVIRSVIRSLYTKLELDYELFNNGQYLLDRLNTLAPEDISLIITDIEMPVMDGLGLLAAIKDMPKYSDVPIVVNTNMANGSIANKAHSLGAQHIIHKLDLDELTEVIYKYAR